MAQVALIGVGELGLRLIPRLLAAGHSIRAHDKIPARTAAAATAGATPSSNLAETACDAEVVITCVTDGPALQTVIDALLPTLTPHMAVIDMTTAEPSTSRALGARLAARGVGFLDTPVSGGIPAAAEGRLNFMVGGDAELLRRWRPLISCMGTVIHHVGPVGTGHAVKAINMMAMASSLLGLGEILAVAQAMGAQPGTVLEHLKGHLGDSYVGSVHFPRYILSGTYTSGFSLALMRKDLRIAADQARELGVPVVIGSRIEQVYALAAANGMATADNTQIVTIFLPNRTWSERSAATYSNMLAAAVELAAAFNVLVAAEAVAVGQAAGLTAHAVAEVLSAGSGGNGVLRRLSGVTPPLLSVASADGPAPLSCLGTMLTLFTWACERAWQLRLACPVLSAAADLAGMAAALADRTASPDSLAGLLRQQAR